MKRFHEYVALADEEYPLTIYSDQNLAGWIDTLTMILRRYDVRECEFDSIRKNQVSPKELPGLKFGDVYVVKAVLGVEPRSAEIVLKEIAANFQPGWHFFVELGEGRAAKHPKKDSVEAFTGTVPGSTKTEKDSAFDASGLYGLNRIEAAMKEAEARAKAKAAKKTEVKFLTAHDTLSEMGIPKRRGVYLCKHDGEKLTVLEMIDADFERGDLTFAASVPEVQAIIPVIEPSTFDEFDTPMAPETALLASLGQIGIQIDPDSIEAGDDCVMMSLVCGQTIKPEQIAQIVTETPDWDVEIVAVSGGATDNGAGCLALKFCGKQQPEISVVEPPSVGWDDHMPFDSAALVGV